jgi:hypothetical protein
MSSLISELKKTQAACAKTDAAGRAAYDETSSVFDSCANWLAAEAVRDYALKTGELSRAIAFINVMYEFGNDPAAHLDFCNIGAAIALSQLLAAQGHEAEAQTLRHAVISWLEANTEKYAGPARELHNLDRFTHVEHKDLTIFADQACLKHELRRLRLATIEGHLHRLH